MELGAFATKADDKFSSIYNREIVSLAKMVAMYLGKTLLKGKVRTSNWEADLSHKMVECKSPDSQRHRHAVTHRCFLLLFFCT